MTQPTIPNTIEKRIEYIESFDEVREINYVDNYISISLERGIGLDIVDFIEGIINKNATISSKMVERELGKGKEKYTSIQPHPTITFNLDQ